MGLRQFAYKPTPRVIVTASQTFGQFLDEYRFRSDIISYAVWGTSKITCQSPEISCKHCRNLIAWGNSPFRLYNPNHKRETAMSKLAPESDSTSASDAIAGWMGVIGIVFFGIGFWTLMEFVPPPSPGTEAGVVASRYLDNAMGIRLGSVFALLGSTLLIPLFAAVSAAILRMSTRSYTLAFTQLACGVIALALPLIVIILYATLVFRPERAAEDFYLLHDFAWLMLVAVAPPPALQALTIGWAVLTDKSEQAVFPRWVGFFCLWVGILLIPGMFAIFFKTGPFAWDGLLAFWLPFGIFFGWLGVMSWKIISLAGASRSDD